ncbi:alpha/beta hydrolase [Paenibacillus sp. CAA11]|uniref:alpha/beta hydrolase n=1 Tax=Paenibacillus sp. CAA11 TaxID=1532905 RepID=UPI001F2D8626|nr:alpha/beta hydrolase [Paenibacillus sp. CAA11]
MLNICHAEEQRVREEGTSLLTLYPLQDHEPHPFMLVLPGGGYQHHARHEGETIARWFQGLGMHAGVLEYQIEKIQPEALIQEVESSLRWVREAEKTWKVNKDQVGLIGFSAGGHLAAISAVTGREKPNLLLLGYPVITLDEPYAHAGSRHNFLGEQMSAERLAAYSADRQVDSSTPSAFLWTTANDASVPVENSLRFAAALSCAGVPFELHVFEEGRHGLGLSEENQDCRQWVRLCENWLAKHHFCRKEEMI